MPKLFKILPIIIVSGFLFLLSNQPQSQVKAAGTTYYVSKNGNNSSGASWTTAWNELDQINWSVIQPGDTILLDGGSTECSFPTKVTGTTNTPQRPGGGSCGMVYQSALEIGKSGASGNPITIKLAEEPGRNGTARIFGGRSTPLPYCGQTNYNSEQARHIGIDFGNRQYIVIDGTKWGGIKIYGHNLWGMNSGSNFTIRNVELFDNGKPNNDDANQPCVALGGINNTFERVIIHDCGQDAFQSGGGNGNIVIKQSWLYNQRPHPSRPNEPFNYCRHSDGIQIYNGGNQYGLTVENSIIGPGFMQGFILGDWAHAGAIATIHDVTVRNTLIVHHHGDSANIGILTKHTTQGPYTNDPPTNYQIDHVTIMFDPDNTGACLYIRGLSHTVKDSIFYGGTYFTVEGSPTASNNTCWQLYDYSNVCGTNTDPMFVDKDFPGVGEEFADFDFTVQSPAIPPGTGSSITSVAQLLGQPLPSPGPSATPGPTSTPTPTPTPSHCSPLGDIDCSGKVNGIDFSYLISSWGTTDPQANLDDTGVVDALDALILLGNYGKTNP